MLTEDYPRFPPLCHPVDQAGLFVPHPLYQWQYDALRAVAEPFSRVAVATCNECLPIDTPIPTPSGWKKIGELKIGSIVFDRFGVPQRVTDVVRHGVNKCWSMELSDGRQAVSSGSHLWVVMRNGAESVIRTSVMAKEIAHEEMYIPNSVGQVATCQSGAYSKIVSIEFAGDRETMCITVSGPTSTFLCNDYMVTHNSGKTSTLGPVFLLSVMCAFPGARVFATSASERQVKEQLFHANLVPIVKQWPDRWKVTTSNMKIEHVNGSVLMCYVCSDPKNVEGFHSKWGKDPRTGKKRWEPCAYLIDEAKGVSDEVFQAVCRINPYFMLAMSSPGEMRGWFYEAIDPETLIRA